MKAKTIGGFVLAIGFLPIQESSANTLYWMRGQVVNVDESHGSLFLRMLPDGAAVNLEVGSQALVAQGCCLLEISDVQKGDEVKVGYSTDKNKRVAQEIILQ